MTAMRIVMLVLGIFIFVAGDIAVNNGASFRAWGYYIATLMRTTGVI